MDPLGSLGSRALEAIWFSSEILWKPLGNPLEPLGSSIGSQTEARVVQRDAKEPTEARVFQRNAKDAKGGQGEAKRTLENLWDSLGAPWKPFGIP